MNLKQKLFGNEKSEGKLEGLEFFMNGGKDANKSIDRMIETISEMTTKMYDLRHTIDGLNDAYKVTNDGFNEIEDVAQEHTESRENAYKSLKPVYGLA
jgi:uncharacterized coiled-coil DUF342 family protein